MIHMTILHIVLLLGSSCASMGEKWQPTDGKLTKKKERQFVKNKKSCFLKIQDAKLAGLDEGTARLAYYHCMQAKGWTLVD